MEPNEILENLKAKYGAPGQSISVQTPSTNPLRRLPSQKQLESVSYDLDVNSVFNVNRHGIISAKYNETIGNTGNEDRLAQSQGAIEKIYKGALKMGAKMNLYAAENIGTWTYGVYKAISDGKLSSLFDNDMTKFFDDQVKKLDTNFAHYYTDEERSRGLLGQMGSWNFWTDQVTNGLAFVGGALIPEVALAVATGGMSAPASVSKIGLKLGMKTFAKEAIEQTAKNTVRNSAKKSFRGLLNNMAQAGKIGEGLGEGIKTIGFATRSSLFEAGMEARENLHDATDRFYQNFEEKFGRAPSLEETKDFLTEAQAQSNGVFWGNMAMLSVSNAVMFGKVIGLKPESLGLKKGWNRLIGMSAETLQDGTKAVRQANKFQKVLGQTSKVATPFITEGLFEEAGQGILGKAMNNYLENKYIKGDVTADYWESFAEGVKEQYSTTEGLKEVMLGGIIGLLGGSVSAAITKPATALGVKGFEGAQFGVEGFFGQSYSAERKDLIKRVEDYNTEVKKFRQTAKANALTNDASFDEKGQVSTDPLKAKSDILSFIKMSEGFKDFADINTEYNTIIDTMEFDPKDLQDQNMSEQDVLNYKEDLKQTFAETLEGYKNAKQITKNLDLSKSGLSEGNRAEVLDALTQTIALSYGARDDAKDIAQQIEQLTGVNGVYSIEKFFNDQEQNNAELTEEYKNLTKEKEQVTNKLAEFGAEYATSKNKTLTETQLKEQAKLREGLVQRLLEIDVKLQNTQEILQERLNTMNADAFTTNPEFAPSVEDVIKGRDALNSYIEALAKAGKTTRATDIKTLLSQFQGLNSIDVAGQDIIKRMYATDFFSKSGKPLIQRIIGGKYSVSEDFLRDLQDNSEMVAPILESLGVNPESIEESVKTLFEGNEALSDREKFLLETVARITLTKEGIDKLANQTQERVEATTLQTPESLGDTIRRNVTQAQPTNIDELNQLITEITNQISILTSKPTLETKRLIDDKRKQLAEAKQRLLDIQNGEIVVEESPIVETSEPVIEEEGYAPGDVIEWDMTEEQLGEVIEDATLEELEEAFSQLVDENGQLRMDFKENGEETQTEEGSDRQLNAESSTPVYEGDSTNATGGAGVVSQETSISSRAKQEEEEALQSLINELEQEIEDLEVPFKFLDSPSYKEYRKLSKKKLKNPSNFTAEEQQRLDDLSSSIDQWGILLGTDINGVTISDLVKQLVHLEEVEVSEDSQVEEITEEEIRSDIKHSEGATKNNFDVTVNTTAVVAKVEKVDGKLLTKVSNITLEGLQDQIGFELLESEYTMHPDTKSISLTQEAVNRINERGDVIISPERVEETGTYSFSLKVRVPDMNGNMVYETLLTDFEEIVSDVHAYNVVAGQELTPIINLDESYNQNLVQEIVEALDNPEVTEEEVEVEVNKLLQKRKSYQNKVQELARLRSGNITTTIQAKINKLTVEIRDIENNLRNDTYDKLLDKKANDVELSSELLQKLEDQLRIDLVDSEGNVVSTVKGARRSTDSKKEIDRSPLENLRKSVIGDKTVIEQIKELETGIIPVPNVKVKVDTVYPGIPTETFIPSEQGGLDRVYRPITQETSKTITDIGYVKGGQVVLRNSTQDVDTTFIRSAIKSNSSQKKPVIVVKKGNRYIAYPARVGREGARVDVTQFTQIRNNENISETDKVIKLNEMLATAGIDVKQPGNSFVALGEGISDEIFNNLLAKLENKEYLSPVDSWVSQDISISDALTASGVETSLDLSDAFKSTKFKLDLSDFSNKEADKKVKEIKDGKDVKEQEVVDDVSNDSFIAQFLTDKNRC